MIKEKCPFCGNELVKISGTDFYKCPFCGNIYRIPYKGRIIKMGKETQIGGQT